MDSDTPVTRKPTYPSKTYRRQRCTRRRSDGSPCKRWAVKGLTCCPTHGGRSLRGADSPTYKHGFRSAYMPLNLQKLYVLAMKDPELLRFKQDLAEVEVLLASVHARIKPDRAVPLPVEARIADLINLRRNLLDSEAKRQRDLQLMVPAERVVQMQSYAAQATFEVITAMAKACGVEPDTWLLQVKERYQRMRLPAVVFEGE